MTTPDQIPLWAWCPICGCPYYGLGLGEHKACFIAVDRWLRSDNLSDWADEPSRAIL